MKRTVGIRQNTLDYTPDGVLEHIYPGYSPGCKFQRWWLKPSLYPLLAGADLRTQWRAGREVQLTRLARLILWMMSARGDGSFGPQVWRGSAVVSCGTPFTRAIGSTPAKQIRQFNPLTLLFTYTFRPNCTRCHLRNAVSPHLPTPSFQPRDY